jgi:hypothetical protein
MAKNATDNTRKTFYLHASLPSPRLKTVREVLNLADRQQLDVIQIVKWQKLPRKLLGNAPYPLLAKPISHIFKVVLSYDSIIRTFTSIKSLLYIYFTPTQDHFLTQETTS